MGRHQVRKGYNRRQHDKHQDREKVAYQKAERKGITGLMDEIAQLKEEVALLDQQHQNDKKVINHQASYIKHLEIEKRKAYFEGAAVAGFLVTVVAALVICLKVWGVW